MINQNDVKQGMKYSCLTVIKRVDDYISPNGAHSARYLCKCDCGNDYITRGSWLKCGKSTCCLQCSNNNRKKKLTKNLINQRFGQWTVIDRAETDKKGVYWLCKCDCGTVKAIRGTSLTTGNSTSCGCFALKKLREDHLLDLVGKRFDRLVVLEQADDFVRKHKSRWKCICDCGKLTYVNGSDLTSGKTHSCGCYKLEKTSENHFKDLSGQRFGMLTVIKRAYPQISGTRERTHFLCKCDCGNQKIIMKDSLMNGTISCGCINSRGERTIAEFLRKNNIIYKIQYSFPNLTGQYGRLLHFDFAVFNDNHNIIALIEYQGEQHFEPVDFFGGNEKFEKQMFNDNIKREYCQKNNLKLIEIPYGSNIESYLSEFIK